MYCIEWKEWLVEGVCIVSTNLRYSHIDIFAAINREWQVLFILNVERERERCDDDRLNAMGIRMQTISLMESHVHLKLAHCIIYF